MYGESLAALVQVLDELIVAAEALIECLHGERRALLGRTVDDLGGASQQKEARLARFDELEQERRLVCASLFVGTDRPAMEALIGAQPYEMRAALAVKWQRLMALTGNCRDLNETNGMIAQTRQRQLLHLLGLMRSGTSAGATYGRTGAAASAGLSTRAIASA